MKTAWKATWTPHIGLHSWTWHKVKWLCGLAFNTRTDKIKWARLNQPQLKLIDELPREGTVRCCNYLWGESILWRGCFICWKLQVTLALGLNYNCLFVFLPWICFPVSILNCCPALAVDRCAAGVCLEFGVMCLNSQEEWLLGKLLRPSETSSGSPVHSILGFSCPSGKQRWK